MEVSCKNNKHLYTLIRNKFNFAYHCLSFYFGLIAVYLHSPTISLADPTGYNNNDNNNNNNNNFISRV